MSGCAHAHMPHGLESGCHVRRLQQHPILWQEVVNTHSDRLGGDARHARLTYTAVLPTQVIAALLKHVLFS